MRLWMNALGYTLILIALFERTYQIKKVYGKVVKHNQLTANITNFW